jgi:CMP-N-acetylneuraminic acid synthetase
MGRRDRRQDKPCCLRATALQCLRSALGCGGACSTARTRGLVMSREESFDIDDRFDLEVAGLLMASRSA